MTIASDGLCDPRFARVREAFAELFDEGLETGAAMALEVGGRPVVDLWGGSADRAGTRTWARDTLAPVFSTTKALTALCVARVVERGALDYDQRVADLWPEFAQNGKDGLTVAQVLSHQGGLSGLPDPMPAEDWFDHDLIAARLAAMTPFWAPGTASGYHPITFGALANEIMRRADGRSIGQILREDFAAPFGLDLWIGLPDAEHDRVAQLEKPKSFADFGARSPEKTAAFMTRWASPGGRGTGDWRRAEFPGANGHATARSLARMLGVIAQGGAMEGRQVLSPAVLDGLTKERVHGQDRVLPFTLAFGAGVMRNLPGENVPGDDFGFYGPSADAVGHSGWGGSCAFADPQAGLSFAYVMNRQSAHLIGDPRPRRLIRAVYESL